MQTKKRAKPVKFNSKADEKKAIKDAAREIEEKVSLNKNEPDVSEFDVNPDGEANTGIETSFSSTTESVETEESEDSESNQETESTKSEEIDDQKSTEKKDSAKESNEDDKKVDIEPKDVDLQKTSKAILSNDAVENDLSKEDLLEKDRAFFNEPPDGMEDKKSSLPFFLKIMFTTFILGLVFFAGIYYAVNTKSIKFPNFISSNQDASPTPPSTTPTSKPIDLSEYSIKVLNGTSTSGVAAKVKTDLESQGFKVQSIGNAESTDFTKTEILAKAKVDKRFVDKLKEVLSKTYNVGNPSSLASGEADVVIKIGSPSAK